MSFLGYLIINTMVGIDKFSCSECTWHLCQITPSVSDKYCSWTLTRVGCVLYFGNTLNILYQILRSNVGNTKEFVRGLLLQGKVYDSKCNMIVGVLLCKPILCKTMIWKMKRSNLSIHTFKCNKGLQTWTIQISKPIEHVKTCKCLIDPIAPSCKMIFSIPNCQS